MTRYKSRLEAEVEDPLEALFDLAKATERRVPRLRVIVSFGMIGGLMAASILIPSGLVLLFFGGVDPLNVELLAGGVVSAVVCALSFHIVGFLTFFQRRLDTIEKIMRWEPHPDIPPGTSTSERVLKWLSQQDPVWEKVLDRPDDRSAARLAKLKSVVSFDKYILRKSWWIPREFHLFVKVFNHPVTIPELRTVRTEIERIVKAANVPPQRILIVQSVDEEIAEEVVDWLEGHWVSFPIGTFPGKETHACPMELLVEGADGKYDLVVPYVG